MFSVGICLRRHLLFRLPGGRRRRSFFFFLLTPETLCRRREMRRNGIKSAQRAQKSFFFFFEHTPMLPPFSRLRAALHAEVLFLLPPAVRLKERVRCAMVVCRPPDTCQKWWEMPFSSDDIRGEQERERVPSRWDTLRDACYVCRRRARPSLYRRRKHAIDIHTYTAETRHARARLQTTAPPALSRAPRTPVAFVVFPSPRWYDDIITARSCPFFFFHAIHCRPPALSTSRRVAAAPRKRSLRHAMCYERCGAREIPNIDYWSFPIIAFHYFGRACLSFFFIHREYEDPSQSPAITTYGETWRCSVAMLAFYR